MAAFRDDKTLVATFEANLEELPGAMDERALDHVSQRRGRRAVGREPADVALEERSGGGGVETRRVRERRLEQRVGQPERPERVVVRVEPERVVADGDPDADGAKGGSGSRHDLSLAASRVPWPRWILRTSRLRAGLHLQYGEGLTGR